MTEAVARPAVSAEELDFFHREGYLIRRKLFSREEAQGLREHYTELHASRAIRNYKFATPEESGDPLKCYPRIMHPHRWDALSLQWLLDPRVADTLKSLLGEDPVATQSMLYFKPPGAKGQAFHQDNFYLNVKPQSCIASWVALDRTDPENGGLSICPRTHTYAVQCPERANLEISFTTELVQPPEGTEPIPAILEPGDTLFFNGSVVHGSTPNRSKDRWRRSFICHYAPRSMQEIAHWYFPVLDMGGKEVTYRCATDGGPCGTEAKGPH